VSVPAFTLEPDLEAHAPAEARGLARDGVRLMVATRHDGRLRHRRFAELPSVLEPGDVLVVNTSATVAAAIGARRAGGGEVVVHVAGPVPRVPGDEWSIVELRTPGGAAPVRGRAGERLDLDGGAVPELAVPVAGGPRLWLARPGAGGGAAALAAHVARHGRPVRYGHLEPGRPLADHQTAFALHPGSAEMPSAARPFTPELVTRLVAGGVLVAPVTLHAGLSSPERHERPAAERYAVPETTARLVGAVRGWGGRVVAVGTTVVRALETVADPGGHVRAGAGWTDLVVTAERGLRAVDGLLTGWHEPEASHLSLLEAAAGPELLDRCYREAVARGYLWHEFGDTHLVLP
jgi:S-adenosylmethionine:tRNA ribosyltransferase-isomerase